MSAPRCERQHLLTCLILATVGLMLPRLPAALADDGDPAGARERTDVGAPKQEAVAARKTTKLTVAVLDFEANDPANPDFGKQIAEVVSVILSGEPGFKLVNRTALTRVLQEQELMLTGLVDTDQAVKVGKLVGARIMVAGRAFRLGKQTFITAKLIGTETSLVDGVIVKGKVDADMADLVMELAVKVGQRLRKSGPKLVAEPDAGRDPLPELKRRLATIDDRPVVAVIVTERHIRPAPARRVIDPAVETEIKLLLRTCGFIVQDVKENELADWARDIKDNETSAWPRSVADADIIITGEAFSEFASRIGNLVSCSARAEINLIRRVDGQVALANRVTTRSVDLSEHIAGKKALQKAGRKLGLVILKHLAKTLAPAEGPLAEGEPPNQELTAEQGKPADP